MSNPPLQQSDTLFKAQLYNKDHYIHNLRTTSKKSSSSPKEPHKNRIFLAGLKTGHLHHQVYYQETNNSASGGSFHSETLFKSVKKSNRTKAIVDKKDITEMVLGHNSNLLNSRNKKMVDIKCDIKYLGIRHKVLLVFYFQRNNGMILKAVIEKEVNDLFIDQKDMAERRLCQNFDEENMPNRKNYKIIHQKWKKLHRTKNNAEGLYPHEVVATYCVGYSPLSSMFIDRNNPYRNTDIDSSHSHRYYLLAILHDGTLISIRSKTVIRGRGVIAMMEGAILEPKEILRGFLEYCDCNVLTMSNSINDILFNTNYTQSSQPESSSCHSFFKKIQVTKDYILIYHTLGLIRITEKTGIRMKLIKQVNVGYYWITNYLTQNQVHSLLHEGLSIFNKVNGISGFMIFQNNLPRNLSTDQSFVYLLDSYLDRRYEIIDENQITTDKSKNNIIAYDTYEDYLFELSSLSDYEEFSTDNNDQDLLQQTDRNFDRIEIGSKSSDKNSSNNKNTPLGSSFLMSFYQNMKNGSENNSQIKNYIGQNSNKYILYLPLKIKVYKMVNCEGPNKLFVKTLIERNFQLIDLENSEILFKEFRSRVKLEAFRCDHFFHANVEYYCKKTDEVKNYYYSFERRV